MGWGRVVLRYPHAFYFGAWNVHNHPKASGQFEFSSFILQWVIPVRKGLWTDEWISQFFIYTRFVVTASKVVCLLRGLDQGNVREGAGRINAWGSMVALGTLGGVTPVTKIMKQKRKRNAKLYIASRHFFIPSHSFSHPYYSPCPTWLLTIHFPQSPT